MRCAWLDIAAVNDCWFIINDLRRKRKWDWGRKLTPLLGVSKGFQQNRLQFLVVKKNCSYLFQTAQRCSLDRQFPLGGEKVFPNKNILCPDIVSSKDDDFSADAFVKPPSPILAELQVSTHIYITFFSKRSVNSGESLLHTARTDWRMRKEMCSSKTSLHFPSLEVNPKPFLFQNSFGLCCHCVSHSFLGKLCNIFLLDQKGQHQRAVWLQSALCATAHDNNRKQECGFANVSDASVKISTPNLFRCSFCNILWFSANPPNITCFWILINERMFFLFFKMQYLNVIIC